MSHRVSEFVFKNRRFIHTTTAAVPIPLKFLLHGTTTLQLWIAGVFLMLLGIAFRMYTAGYLSGAHTTTSINADHICTSGPFAYIRNPLYLGNFVIGLSLAIAFNEWYGYLVFAIHYVTAYSILIPYEEKFLADKFGETFTEYCAHSRRFFPKLKPFKGGPKVTPNFKLGILSEKYYFLILILLFAILFFLFVK
jgi:protein-S-isoprenylcysteine O-methyltransferase Ste14